MDLSQFSLTLILLVLLALAFDFMNGFHDAANSIATVVSTGVLKPWQAVLWAAFFNVLAWAVFHLSVAATVGKGIIDPAFVDNRLIFGALIGAITWNLITWYYGIPSSSSHALIGGMIGAALIKAGTAAPARGPASSRPRPSSSSRRCSACSSALAAHADRVVDVFPADSATRGQVVPAAAAGFVRGLQHGPRRQRRAKNHGHHLAAADRHGRTTKDHLPTWVVMSCFLAIGIGTMFGGWRIVKTMGQRITKLKPVGGFAAECAGSITLFMATHFGIPVSTTHTITGAIIGVGTTRGTSAVRWGVAGNIVIAWIITIPASAGIAALGGGLAGCSSDRQAPERAGIVRPRATAGRATNASSARRTCGNSLNTTSSPAP